MRGAYGRKACQKSPDVQLGVACVQLDPVRIQLGNVRIQLGAAPVRFDLYAFGSAMYASRST